MAYGNISLQWYRPLPSLLGCGYHVRGNGCDHGPGRYHSRACDHDHCRDRGHGCDHGRGHGHDCGDGVPCSRVLVSVYRLRNTFNNSNNTQNK